MYLCRLYKAYIFYFYDFKNVLSFCLGKDECLHYNVILKTQLPF